MSETIYEQDLEQQVYLFNTGQHFEAYRTLGNHPFPEAGPDGVVFRVWAPNAASVKLIGDMNDWLGQDMSPLGQTGIWHLVTHAREGQCYKYQIGHANGYQELKIDPFSHQFEIPPKDASIVGFLKEKTWKDGQWYYRRRSFKPRQKPMNIYEVHAGSWRRKEDGSYLTFQDLASQLIPYVKDMGYSHIEFLPLMDHPLEASWGYQITGFFALFGKLGSLSDFQDFVEEAHRQGIGILLDWVPGHFCRNQNALAYYDGTACFEYQDPDRADNRGWGTLNFDLGKTQVQSFLISSAIFWLKECHVDGLRVDAVSNMLYLDFDNPNWRPNIYGGNGSLEGISFLQKFNQVLHQRLPHVITIAEESTDWQGITSPVDQGGLGFDFKWNMGWMNDILKFMEMDPLYRQYHYRLLTFSLMYLEKEAYLLPFSHDEVVHGKRSLLDKIPGFRQDQLASLRLLMAYMFAHPGKVLNFMGNELGQYLEWRFYEGLQWQDLDREGNRAYQSFLKTLHHFYAQEPALSLIDQSYQGIDVLEADNPQETILAFIRKGLKRKDQIITIFNFVPVERQNYRIGLPGPGRYRVVVNSQAKEWGGTWDIWQQDLIAQDIPHQGQAYSSLITLPSLGALYIKQIEEEVEESRI